ncbi:MAG TPA: DUF411 domain-containing protein [Azospira sp.]|nr:DUF411 domain-containing protein [Azospira sp.]
MRWFSFLAGAFVLLLALVVAPAVAQEGKGPVIEIFHESGCKACEAWEAQLRSAGFVVRRSEVLSVASTRRWLALPENFASYVTARIGGYLIEGPVPPAQIKQLLKEQPTALGLARPGVPTPADAQTLLMFWGGRSSPFPAVP